MHSWFVNSGRIQFPSSKSLVEIGEMFMKLHVILEEWQNRRNAFISSAHQFITGGHDKRNEGYKLIRFLSIFLALPITHYVSRYLTGNWVMLKLAHTRDNTLRATSPFSSASKASLTPSNGYVRVTSSSSLSFPARYRFAKR